MGSKTDLLDEVLDAQERDLKLLASPQAARIVESLSTTLRSLGSTAVLAASPSGERVVGAMLLLAKGDLHMWHPGDSAPVVLVDGVVTSTAGLQSVMDRVRRLGGRCAGGLAISWPSPDEALDPTVLIVQVPGPASSRHPDR